MGPVVPPPRLIRFGVFELDLRSGELQKQGRKIRLEGQPVQVLVCLLENPGELVSREELHRKLWAADTFVNFEHGLNAAVKRLRQALNDSADNPRFVETLPRRGYRFIAPVQTAVVDGDLTVDSPVTVDPGAAKERDPVDLLEKPASTPVRRLPRAFMWAGVALIAILGIILAWRFQSGGYSSPSIRSLAVLPLENLSGDASQEYFSEGMTDELITELGQISELRVISRTSAMTYKGAHKSLPEIARDLNVDAVIEGAVARSGNRVRITAQLIQAATDKHLWARSYDGELGDSLALQKQVARAIAAEIRIELTPHEQAALKTGTRISPEAYEAYLKGRYFWNKRTQDGLRMAIDYFNQVISANPNYAEAYAGLADSYALLGDWEYGVLSPRDAYTKAEVAARKALDLDSGLGEAHISLAFCLDSFDWDWDAAGREFQKGIELNPGYATGHQWYAWHLTALGRTDEAVAEMREARSLDPLSLIISADLADELLIARRYDEAVKQSRKTIAMDPFFGVAHYELGQALAQKRMYPEAIAELQKARQLSSGSATFASALADVYAVSGKKKEALEIVNDLKNNSHHTFSKAFASNAPAIALVYTGLNDKDQAMEWLEKAYSERFNPTILLRPGFDPLRSDSRFQGLLSRIGLRR
jgi:TolB-like protein/DNA-binding winged helix-turn-helix (wHTH) protein/Flp pilus assembly protein TadD